MKTASFLAGLVGVSALAMLAIADERVAMPNPTLTPGAIALSDNWDCPAGYKVTGGQTPPGATSYALYENGKLVGTCYRHTVTVAEICAPGYAKAHRMPYGSHGEYMRYKAMMDEYGIPHGRWHLYADDDLIPLELGGDNASLLNHWPQPREESYRKDRLENETHRQVCDGTRSLDDARQQMMTGAW